MFDRKYLLFIGLSFGCQSPPADPLILPQGLEIIELNDTGVDLCYGCEKKVVVFHNFNESMLVPFSPRFTWKEQVEKYPDISVIVYASGDDKAYVTRKLEEYKFPFSVVHDPEFSFYKANNLDTVSSQNKKLIPYLVKGDQVVGIAEIGMPEIFEKQLKELSGQP